MKKREYKIEDGYSEYLFNELGKEGWELFFVDTHSDIFIFKREIKEEEPLQTEAMKEMYDKIIELKKENEKLKGDLYIWKLTARDYARLQGVDLPELSDI